LRRVFRTIIEVFVLPMFHAGQYLPLGGAVALQFIGHKDPGHELTAFKQLAEELLRCFLVAPALYQNIEHMTGLIDGAPEAVPLAIDHEKDFI
jgi:hypothetical protein